MFENMGSKAKGMKHTQSLSFRTAGTPISSNVFGPLPGRGFWLADVDEEEEVGGGLGVEGADSLDGGCAGCENEAVEGDDTAGRGEAMEPCEGGDMGVLTGFRSAPSRRGGRRRGSAPGGSIGAEKPISSFGVDEGLRMLGGLVGPAVDGVMEPLGWRYPIGPGP